MLFREIIAVCSQLHSKHINTLCGQNVELLNVKLVIHKIKGRTWKNHFNLQLTHRYLVVQFRIYKLLSWGLGGEAAVIAMSMVTGINEEETQFTYNIKQARSRNLCKHGKAIRVTYSECLSVALIIDYAKPTRHIVIVGLSAFTVLYRNCTNTSGIFRGVGGY
jgi:hypothetical protein